jgi:plastocyanin
MPSGGTQTETVDEEGTELYQCCIHPWMRATVVAKR